MKLEIVRIEDKPNRKGCGLVIGNFDGVHRGHAMLIANARVLVGGDRDVAVLSFNPHTRKFFNPCVEPFLIQNNEEKLESLDNLGVDLYCEVDFDKSIANLSPDGFVRKFIQDRFCPSYVVVGENFRFAKNRAGSIEDLENRDFRVVPVNVCRDREFGYISSSLIREKLAEGRVEEVGVLLGRWYSVAGEVVSGEKIAQKHGVSTANIVIDEDRTSPAFGVYVVRISVDSRQFFGVANLGVRPTMHSDDKVYLEAHIFDFNRSLYGSKIKIELIYYIREERKFSSEELLFDQVKRDISTARSIIEYYF